VKYDDEGRPICKHCGRLLNEEDDLDMESGYCSEECHLAGTFEDDEDDD